MNLSGVSITFTALHFDPILDEGWHVHEFTVTAWRKSEPWSDGRSAYGALDTLLLILAPVNANGVRELSSEMWNNESIARACCALVNVVKVNVDRTGFHAEIWA
jgi:hypothetical protein